MDGLRVLEEAAVEAGDKDDVFLTPDDEQFIESLGLHFEDKGIPRIGGRMLGLLMLAPKPLSLGRIAELLKVSPASVSTNVRQFHDRGLVEEMSIPGDRRHYYLFSDTAWEHQFEEAIEGLTEVLQIMRARQERLRPEERVCAQRLSAATEFFTFFLGTVESALDRWRSRSKEPQPPATPAQSRNAS
jgi:DNA-binding transcriptional regulator GbsR (MarR family)